MKKSNLFVVFTQISLQCAKMHTSSRFEFDASTLNFFMNDAKSTSFCKSAFQLFQIFTSLFIIRIPNCRLFECFFKADYFSDNASTLTSLKESFGSNNVNSKKKTQEQLQDLQNSLEEQ